MGQVRKFLLTTEACSSDLADDKQDAAIFYGGVADLVLDTSLFEFR